MKCEISIEASIAGADALEVAHKITRALFVADERDGLVVHAIRVEEQDA